MSLIAKAVKRPWLVLPYLIVKFGKHMDDETYIKILYFLRNGKKLNLENPKTYFEKINWIKLHDRRPEYTVMADKYRSKKYVGEKIGYEYIIPIVKGGVWEDADAIDLDLLPDQFVLKTTHDGGNTYICTDKKTFDFEGVRRRLKEALKRNYYYLSREWPYKNIRPRIICEKYIPGIVDCNYKFFCFDGTVRFLYVAPYREQTADYFDGDYQYLPGIHNAFHGGSQNPPPKPENFEKMKELAQILSKGYPQMRVDFYNDHGKIYFGEITFFQEGGFAPWIPDEWNVRFGNYIDLGLCRNA